MAQATQSWAAMEFRSIDLGEKRLNRRAVLLAEQLSGSPLASIPEECGGWAETAAAYRFLAQDRLEWSDILDLMVKAHEIGCPADWLLRSRHSRISSWPRGVLEPTIHSDDAPFLPIVAERLFSTYLSLHPELKVAAYPIEGDRVLDYCVSDFERAIVRYMQKPIGAADRVPVFPPEQIALMNLLCTLSQKYVRAFLVHPAPAHRATDRLRPERQVGMRRGRRRDRVGSHRYALIRVNERRC
ncbi:IS4/Tn5 family transposase DNA-binding protein [Paraburkholderia sp. HP33-1]|uniref:IS4/Tn5 family transposase DNA-binding protein n=1 Tax=Paraburkholderia sp. HP33-1 TaxID=2883243 RepID=UPI001F378EB0|nr:transposase [Paraburkholderia sp. HP33-1]